MIRTGLATLTATLVLLLGLSCSSDGPKASHHASASKKRPYVVLLVMDEFPGDSLLDRRRRIDPVRYPNFAALAGDATWFRNAFSVYDSTTKAVPLILDGLQRRHLRAVRLDELLAVHPTLQRCAFVNAPQAS